MIKRLLTSILAISFFSAPALAETTELIKLDSRAKIFGWHAIGRIDIADHGTCSGVLIEPDLVLTAAHCVTAETGERYLPEFLVFKAGYYNGKAAAVRHGQQVVYAPNYKPTDGVSASNVRNDIALIRLERPISPGIAPAFRIHDGDLMTMDVSSISYGRGRNEYPSLQHGCKLTDIQLGLYHFNCDLDQGSSGAPIFTLVDGSPRILTLVSGGNRDGEEIQVVGMVLPDLVDHLKESLASEEDPQLSAQAPITNVRPTFIQIGSGSDRTGSRSGARFVRP